MRINHSWGEKSPRHSLFICSPSYSGEFSAEYVKSQLGTCKLLDAEGVTYEVQFEIYNSLPCGARNNLADKFMKSGMDRMLTIDSDQGWDPRAVLRVLDRNDAFITGAVPGRKAEETYALKIKHNKEMTPRGRQDDKGMLIEAESNGVAFAMIHRAVFEKIRDAHPYPQDVYPFFQHRYFTNGDEHGEDMFFTKSAQEFCTVWIDPDITFTHGPITANFLEYLKRQSPIDHVNNTLDEIESAINKHQEIMECSPV